MTFPQLPATGNYPAAGTYSEDRQKSRGYPLFDLYAIGNDRCGGRTGSRAANDSADRGVFVTQCDIMALETGRAWSREGIVKLNNLPEPG